MPEISYVTLPTSDSSAMGNNSATSQSPSEPTQVNGANPNANITNNNIDINNPFYQPINNNKADTQTPPTNPQANNTPSNPPITFDDIVKQKHFGNLPAELFSSLNEEGGVEKIQDAFQSALRSVYKTAIEDANKLMEDRFKQYQQKTLDTVNRERVALEAVADLKKAVPLANDPAVETVARTVYSGYLRQGMSKTEALGATSQYFSQLADKVNQSNKPSEGRYGKFASQKESLDDLFNSIE